MTLRKRTQSLAPETARVSRVASFVHLSLHESDNIAGVKLEDLQATAAVRGILTDGLVTVVDREEMG